MGEFIRLKMDIDKFIEETLKEFGQNGGLNFYMKLAWKKAQKELMLEITNKTDWSNGEILEFINNKLISLK